MSTYYVMYSSVPVFPSMYIASYIVTYGKAQVQLDTHWKIGHSLFAF